MLLTPLVLDIISLAYGIFAMVTIVNLVKNRGSFFDSRITSDDARLANAFAFCLLWPPAVLLHEGGHALVAALFGAQDIRLHFFFYWGEITYDPRTLTDRQDWWVSLAGNGVTYLLGFVGLALSRLPRRWPIWRFILYRFASNQLFVVLLWYPGLCLLGAFNGDFNIIYNRSIWWIGSTAVAVVNAVTLAGYGWVNYTESGREWLLRYLWSQPAPTTAPYNAMQNEEAQSETNEKGKS